MCSIFDKIGGLLSQANGFSGIGLLDKYMYLLVFCTRIFCFFLLFSIILTLGEADRGVYAVGDWRNHGRPGD